MGDWLGTMAPWQWFVTVTLDPGRLNRGFTKAGMGTARRALRLLLAESRAVEFVCVFELHRSGVPHLHALLSGCPAINGAHAAEWMNDAVGLSRFKVFNPEGQAPAYIGKYLNKEMVELYIGTAGPYTTERFKVRDGTGRFTWDTTMAGTRV